MGIDLPFRERSASLQSEVRPQPSSSTPSTASMPPLTVAELLSSENAPSSSIPRLPTDSAGDPLPGPTTLATHTRGPRLLRSSSRSSRGSRTSSNAGSRHSSQSRQAESNEPMRVEPPATRSGLLVPEGSSTPTTSLHYRMSDATGRPFAQAQGMGHIWGNLEETPLFDAGSLSAASLDPETVNWSGSSISSLSDVWSRGWEQDIAESSRKRNHDELDSDSEELDELELWKDFDSEVRELDNSAPIIPLRQLASTGSKQKGKRRNTRNYKAAQAEAGPSTLPTMHSQLFSSEPDVEIIRLPGEIAAEQGGIHTDSSSSSSDVEVIAPPAPITSEPLAEYACPICFSPPTNATLTPCGHVCCGECLFTAVHSALQRAPAIVGYHREPIIARCPVCRAQLNGWDGKGGGVIGLKPRTVISL